MHLTSFLFSILNYVSLVQSAPTTPKEPRLKPRGVPPLPEIQCCTDFNVHGWGEADKFDIIQTEPKGPFKLAAGPGKCQNLYTTNPEQEKKWGHRNELWICNDLSTSSTAQDLDLAVAVSLLATKCRIGDYQFCGQAFTRYSGYDTAFHPVDYNFNIIVNGTQALAPTDTDVSNCLDNCK